MKFLSNKRQKNEDFDAYRVRRAFENGYIKMHLKIGVMFWPASKGTYRNDGRGLCHKP